MNRPQQTDFNELFHNDLDYPRLGGVSFRRGSLTDNQAARWDEYWPTLGTTLADRIIDIDDWFGRSGAKTIVEIGSGTGTSGSVVSSASS